MADDLECSYLTSIFHMSTDAGTCIIIPYPHYAESLRCILREFAKVHDSSSQFAIHELDGDIMILGDFFIDLCFNLCNLICSRLCI